MLLNYYLDEKQKIRFDDDLLLLLLLLVVTFTLFIFAAAPLWKVVVRESGYHGNKDDMILRLL